MTEVIHLTQGKLTKVNACDYRYLSQWKWYFDRYAVRNLPDNGKMYMHRAVLIRMGLRGADTDHIDGDKLNNTRRNLRPATRQQNIFNTGLRANNTSGHRGVQWCRDRNKWTAMIKINGKNIRLGRFNTKEEVAKAYYAATLKHHKEFAFQIKVDK